MKALINSTILIFLFSLVSFSQEDRYAKVGRIQNAEIYILNEPVRPYEVVYGQGQGVNWVSYYTKGQINESIVEKIQRFVKAADKKAKRGGKTIDAILYKGGKRVEAIKFTDEPTEDNERKAKVVELHGIVTYAMCEPYDKFTVTKNIGPGIKWKSKITKGYINNSIEEDIEKFAIRYLPLFKAKKIDAILYSYGKKCEGIRFVE